MSRQQNQGGGGLWPRTTRVSRACDKCSIARTRCIRDGDNSCRRCHDYRFICEVKRSQRKPGRPARRQPPASAPTNIAIEPRPAPARSEGQSATSTQEGGQDMETGSDGGRLHDPGLRGYSWADEDASVSLPGATATPRAQNTELDSVLQPSADIMALPLSGSFPTAQGQGRSSGSKLSPNRDRSVPTRRSDGTESDASRCSQAVAGQLYGRPTGRHSVSSITGSGDPGVSPGAPAEQRWNVPQASTNNLEHSVNGTSLPPLGCLSLPNDGHFGLFDAGYPGPTNLIASPVSFSGLRCRYNVLRPLLPYLTSIISPELACELLDLYFKEPSCSLFDSASPYVVAQIFRKRSFLCESGYRKTSAALLAAMIWVAAQTSDASIFKTRPQARARICDQIYRLCEMLITNRETDKSRTKSGHLWDTAWEIPISHSIGPFKESAANRESDGSLDDILTYALIGTVISGSEMRKESLWWWAKAWITAKELSLNLEQSETEAWQTAGLNRDLTTRDEGDACYSDLVSLEESREERRRTWWLLYMADRHLALSYNAPLNILDAECRVYQPMEESRWQNLDTELASGTSSRQLGPGTVMSGDGIFEFFLPLMAILGDIIDIHHVSRHPRFHQLDQEARVLRVETSLDTYANSLNDFEAGFAPTPGRSQGNASRQPPTAAHDQIRVQTVVAYSRHLLHVLYILLHGSWDPINMLDGHYWITANSFVKCATHSISAASAVSEILRFDPELSYMPYLFGIYLLHGSFILLIFADRMDMATSDTVTSACETIVRAHEICVATLNTEYQRTFRKVMRSALNFMRGDTPVDVAQHKARRRQLLYLYRWTEEGKGLAV